MKKNLGKRLADMLLGRPEVHKPDVRMNRKQKRMQQSMLRKRAAALARRHYERKR